MVRGVYKATNGSRFKLSEASAHTASFWDKKMCRGGGRGAT